MRMRMVVWLVLVALVCSAVPALAWGTGAHLVIAKGVAEALGVTGLPKTLALQVAYGAIAPDFAWVAWEPLSDELGAATHFDPGYVEPWERATTTAQRAFAYGFLSHNNVWGADFWAHSASPFEAGDGYVIDRAAAATALGVPPEAAHDYVEVAIDLLLDQEFPEYQLGNVISRAASSRSGQIPDLLVRCYRDVPGASGPMIRLLESTFRAGVITYGQSLALPTGADDAAMAAALSVAHGVGPAESALYLEAAKLVCLDPWADYLSAIDATVALVADGPWPAVP
jgi:hypothetical protein